VDSLGEAFSSGIINIVLDLLMIGGTLAAMFWLDARLTLVLLLLAPPIVSPARGHPAAAAGPVLGGAGGPGVGQHLPRRAGGRGRGGAAVRQRGRERADLRRPQRAASGDATTRSNVYDALMYAVVDGAASIFVAVMLWYGSGLAEAWGCRCRPPSR
jgi:ATP-binding cassette, subfamily B, multidrug efflux pump